MKKKLKNNKEDNKLLIKKESKKKKIDNKDDFKYFEYIENIFFNPFFINFLYIFLFIFSIILILFPYKSGFIGLKLYSNLFYLFSYGFILLPFVFLISVLLYNFRKFNIFYSTILSFLWFLSSDILINRILTKKSYISFFYLYLSKYIGDISTFIFILLIYLSISIYIVGIDFQDVKDIFIYFLNLFKTFKFKKDINIDNQDLDVDKEYKVKNITKTEKSQLIENNKMQEVDELQVDKQLSSNASPIIEDRTKLDQGKKEDKLDIVENKISLISKKKDFKELKNDLDKVSDFKESLDLVKADGKEFIKDKEGQLIYQLPDTSILYKALDIDLRKQKQQKPIDYSELLEKTLLDFGVKAKVVNILQGPTVTRYELQPAKGVKVSRIVQLSDDIALALAALSIRIEAPIPGKSVVGIEVPNDKTSTVLLADLLSKKEFKLSKSPLSIAIGKDITGNIIIADLVKMPHLLIAGATGSGKTVCINSLIASLLFKAFPTQVQFIMIDPKRVELTLYNGIPHLIEPVITDSKLAAKVLIDLTKLMDDRYSLFEKSRVRNISEYNKLHKDEALPYIVVIIDELADLMMAASSSVETSIARLAQLARAAGIHLIVATQRPSVNVITGLIKANIPSRIAFAVSSQIDSRTILDHAGAEKLLGRGDMLFSPVGVSKAIRVQGALVTLSEIEALVEFWSSQKVPENLSKINHSKESIDIKENLDSLNDDIQEGSDDDVYKKAKELVITTKRASVTYLQRKLKIGFARAGRIMDMLEKDGIVSPAQGSKPRRVLVDRF